MAVSSTPSLSRQAIIDAGVSVVADRGVDGLSMRRLADRLGVWPTAIYHYVETREQLAELVCDAVVGIVELPAPDLEPLAWLEQLAWRLRRVALAHPGLAIYLLQTGPSGPGGEALAEAAAARLAQLGHRGQDLARVYNLFFTWLAGAIHKTERFLAPGGRERVERFHRRIEAVEPDTAPHVVEIRATFRAMQDDPDGAFAWSLDRMLHALVSGS